MTKIEFILALKERLGGLPNGEILDRLTFYTEMIEDRIEDGLTEEEAVADIGSVDEIAAQITSEISLFKLAKEKIKPKRKLKGWEIALIALGSPIWVALIVSAFALIISLYAAVWSVIAAFWAAFAAFAASAVGCLAGGMVLICTSQVATGLVAISAAFICAGLAVFSFFGCLHATRGTAVLTKKIALATKKRFIRKGEAQ